ncbi:MULTISPECIES: hypothetical protein [unclassified Streptomyces]|uniref:hypothetical protein n=1 Tax=unclassified Streptomyces TaxID=2593676 RepID=UPI0035D6E411
MTADPNEPDTFAEKEDVVLDEETPEADAAEQHAELQQHEDEPLSQITHESANDADAAEQARVVTLDEDDYR